jgi:hypothetical protein
MPVRSTIDSTMSSASLTSSRKAGAADAEFRIKPAHFFALASAATAGAVAIVLRQSGPAEIVLAIVTVAAAGVGAIALYRTLQPLVDTKDSGAPTLVGGRTRAALERDKALTLRAIKELEFDHAMGKLSDNDFSDMRRRLRERALRLMQQLEGGTAYRDRIEQDVRNRVAEVGRGGADAAASTCAGCGTANDADARFCKMCGHALRQ